MTRRTWTVGVAIGLASATAHAGDTLAVVETRVDPPTVINLGVQVVISDDDDRDAAIGLRWREAGAPDWHDGLALVRVHPEKVTGLAVPQQFAGSVFDLKPGTDHEIELHAVDPDGLDTTWTVMAATRPVPRSEPSQPHAVAVADVAALKSALAAATAGDVIEVAAGTYVGPFAIEASGTLADPIVIRGAGSGATLLDGGSCTDCNVLEVYGSFVHIERLALQNANRALRFQTAGATGNVVRRTEIRGVNLGIGAREDQRDFYLCDNKLTGALVWPQVYGDDGGMFANLDGINVQGDGHVVCHNDLIGFGDALKTEQDGARGVDFYGNITRSAYDNAIELDGSAGNTRAFRNLLVNSWSPLSFQPIFGGPAYAYRNVVVNLADEQHKLHSNLQSGETVGAIIVHNTFVSPRHAINLQAAATAHDFVLANNLYVGPAAPENGKVVDWSVPVDGGTIDPNAYYPDGTFDFNNGDSWPSFAAMQAAGKYEADGVLLMGPVFASGLVAPADYTTEMDLPDAALAAGSAAVDAAVKLANLNDAFAGAGPDLGALEQGCDAPLFGVRPEGVDENNMAFGCGDDTGDSDSSDTGDDSDGTGNVDTGSDTGSPTDPGSDDGISQTGDELPTSGGPGSAGTGAGDGGTDDGPSTTEPGQDDDSGCGCRSDGSPAGLALLLLLAGRRRRTV